MAITSFDFSLWQTYASLVIMFLLGGFCSSIGIGGGVLLSPILLMLGFDAKFALPCTNAFVTGGAIVSLFIDLFRRRPRGRPFISWPLLLLTVPSSLITVFFGVLFNTVAPFTMVNIMLVILLALSSFNFFRKARRLQLASRTAPAPETTTIVDNAPVIDTIDTSDTSKHENSTQEPEITVEVAETGVLEAEPQPASAEKALKPKIPLGAGTGPYIYPGEPDQSGLYWPRFLSPLSTLALVAIWGANVACSLWIGLSGAKNCDTLAIVLNVVGCAITLVLLLVVLFFDFYARRIPHRARLAAGGAVAGFFSSALGIGGGIVLTPLLLSMGVDPVSTAATSSSMISLNSSSATLQYLALGALTWFNALISFALGALGSLIGKLVLRRFLEGAGGFRITYSLGAITVLCATIVIIRTAIDIPTRGWGSFVSYCSD